MLKCYVVDDEPHAIETLVNYIEKSPDLQLVGTCQNPIQAIGEISVLRPDITFLDIDMPELSGLQLADMIGAETVVIFTTAFKSYALEAFEKNASDFLLKPVTFERFLKSVKKVSDLLRKISEGHRITRDYFFINPGVKGKLIKLHFSEIIYIEGLQNYIQIFTGDNKYITYLNMKEIEAGLPATLFSRIHKSYIINNERIKSVEGNKVILNTTTQLPIGANFKSAFMARIGENFIRTSRK